MQRLRDMRWAAMLVLLFIVPLLLYVTETWEDGPEVVGTVTGLHADQSEVPQPARLVVRLADGSEVVAGGSENVLLRKGERVVLKQSESNFFGFRRYRFVRSLPSESLQ